MDYCPLDEKKDLAILFSNLAISQFRLEKYEDSIQIATKAIENDEQYAKPLIWRGHAYYQLEKYEESLEGN